MAYRSLLLVRCLFSILILSPLLHHHVHAASVFAHYMLWAPSSIDDPSGFISEINYAKSKGIDAFALNTNLWNQEPYKRRAQQIYQAAQQVGGFKIFFSLDMHRDANHLSASDVIDMITTFSGHPAQYYHNGKQLVTTWLGNDANTFDGFSNALEGWNQAVFSKLPGGRNNYFFIPFFPTGGSQPEVANMLSTYNTLIDGLFAWDTSAWPYINNDFNNPSDSKDRAYLAACTNAGKLYMAAVSPWFFKHDDCCNGVCRPDTTENNVACGCQVKGNYKGPGLWIRRWEQLITLRPGFVEIVTWNDWAERSYVAPIGNPNWGPQNFNDVDFPHEAFMELGAYYISWYKSGSRPGITRESVLIFYYTQSRSALAKDDPCRPQNVAQMDDRVYVVSMLRSPAQVVVESGGSTQTFSAQGGGVEVFSMPFSEGRQVGRVRRNNAEVLQVVGKKSISNDFNKYDYNVCSGFTTSSTSSLTSL